MTSDMIGLSKTASESPDQQFALGWAAGSSLPERVRQSRDLYPDPDAYVAIQLAKAAMNIQQPYDNGFVVGLVGFERAEHIREAAAAGNLSLAGVDISIVPADTRIG